MALAPMAAGCSERWRRKKARRPDGGRRAVCAGSTASERLDQFRNCGEEILFETVVGDAEDRRLGILVDRDDDLRVLHPGEVLDRAADADGDVELRGDDLAGLADLPVVRRIAGVDRGAARAERGAELVGERRQDLVEFVARAERAAA